MALGHDWIHDVYRCAVDELSWRDVLKPLMQEMRATCAGVVKHSIAPIGAEVLVRVDVDPAAERAYVDQFVHENPVMNCLSAMPLGYVTTGSGAVDENFYFATRFYNEWQKPADFADNMGVSLARRQGQFVMLSLPRSFKVGVYSRDDIRKISTYVPHLVRAFNIWMRLRASEAQAGWMSEALDQMAQGLIIMGSNQLILYANKGAEKLLTDGALLQRVNFRLRVADDEVAARLDAILRLFETGAADETQEYGLAVSRGPDRTPLFLRVQPPLGIRPGQRKLGLPQAVAFIHVVDPEERGAMSFALVGEVYNLTAGETRFLETLVRTESVSATTDTLAIKDTTARTHLQRIYQKTGADSLARLLSLVHRHAAR